MNYFLNFEWLYFCRLLMNFYLYLWARRLTKELDFDVDWGAGKKPLSFG